MKKRSIKKWIIAFVLVIVLAAGAIFGGYQVVSATEQKKAEETARGAVPDGAVLRETDRDHGDYEFTFFDETAKVKYEVTVGKDSGAVEKVETEFYAVRGSETHSLTEEDIKAFVQETWPGAEILFLGLGVDDGLYSYEASFYTDSLYGTAQINASTGELMESVIKYSTPIVIPSDSSNSSSNSSYLTEEDIRSKIQETWPDSTLYSIYLDYDDGRYEYETIFYCQNVIYEVNFNASTGEILEQEQKGTGWSPWTETSSPTTEGDTQTGETTSQTGGTESPSQAAETSPAAETSQEASQPSTQPQSDVISRDAISQTILSKAEGTGAVIAELKLERDDGRVQYEGEMYDSSYEYEFELDAYTGTIIKWEKEAFRGTSQSSDAVIGEEEAQNIALAKTGSQATVIKCRLERDDGRLTYELELRDSRYEYDVEIDAYTGTILSWDMDD